jgi:hypothetical protein
LIIFAQFILRKGKPIARWGHKADGSRKGTAGLPEKREFFPEDVRMQKTLKKVLIAAGAALFCALPAVAAAKIQGQCSDCHIMHNSEQGEPVFVFDSDPNNPSPAPNFALLRMDCVGCHSQGTGERIVTFPGGDQVPQVYHNDPVGDTAAGNFAYISGFKPVEGEPGSRKGHDLIDFELLDNVFLYPPGFRHSNRPDYFQVENFTCAGKNGCHGWRNQLMEDDEGNFIPRIGLEAIKGAHHANEDGQLMVADTVADSYRFLMGLFGLENSDPNNRWQNVSAVSHNEYYGHSGRELFGTDGDCFRCHVASTDATPISYITTPNNSMSGFCATCHSDFHANQGAGTSTFLRHPSDFVIPDRGEYSEYTTYELTAPVARPFVYDTPSSAVQPGQDLVMCLSCHLAHAGPYDGMLRFGYADMTAGITGDAPRTGCLVCHTAKGR